MNKQKKKIAKQIKAEDIFLITIFIICFCVATYSGIKIIQWFLNNKAGWIFVDSNNKLDGTDKK